MARERLASGGTGYTRRGVPLTGNEDATMEQTTTIERRPTQATCVHHWVIESPNGRESRGKCKMCGKAKVFANSNENVMWEQTNTLRNDLGRSVRVPRPEDLALSDEQ